MSALALKLRAVAATRWGSLLGVFLFVPAAQAVVYFALDPRTDALPAAGVGAVWVSVLFAAVWLIEELLREEWQAGAIEVYAIAGAEERFFWEWTLLGGALVALLVMLAWAVAGAFYSLDLVGSWGGLAVLAAVFGWGTAGLTVLVRQLAHGAGAGSFLAPLLLFPLETPILLGCVQASRAFVLDAGQGENWMLLGLFFGILYLVLGAWVVPSLLKE